MASTVTEFVLPGTTGYLLGKLDFHMRRSQSGPTPLVDCSVIVTLGGRRQSMPLLHAAVASNNVIFVEEVLRHKPILNVSHWYQFQRTQFHGTPLLWATRVGCADIVGLLIAAGASIIDEGILESMLMEQSIEGVAAVLHAGARVNWETVWQWPGPTTHVLLKLNDANVLVGDPLHHAAKAGKRDVVRALLLRGADVTAISLNTRQKPVHVAANDEIIRDLLVWERTGMLRPMVEPAAATPTPWLCDIEFTRAWCENRKKSAAERLSVELQRHGLTRINVVLVGPTASGKSSLINSVASLVTGRVRELAQAGCGAEPVTWQLGEFRLEELPQLAFVDTRGWLDASDEVRLVMLLSGMLHVGADLTLPLDAEAFVEAAASGAAKPSARQPVHAVVVVVPYDVEQDAPMMVLVKRSCDYAQRFGVRVVLAVTQIDECGDAAVAECAAAVVTSGTVQKLLSRVAAASGVAMPSVVAVQNVAARPEMDWAAAALVWKAMEVVIERALDGLEANALAASTAEAALSAEERGGELALGAALLRVVGAANEAKIAKWVTLLNAQDLDTVGDVRRLTTEAFELMAAQAWCTVALHSALIQLRRREF
jgi:energy-coupling factor transporter ATP-binding protein EcfA2